MIIKKEPDMKITPMRKWFWMVFAGIGVAAALAGEEKIIRHPDPGEPLAQRWEWAMQTAGQKTDFWIGYSIRRVMGEDSHIGSFHYPPREGDMVLQELIYGSETPPGQPQLSEEEELRRAAERALGEAKKQKAPENKVLKEVAFLFRIHAGARPASILREVHVSNLSLAVDLNSLPLYWLNGAENGQSLTLLQNLFEKESSAPDRDELVAAAGLHDDPVLVIPVLQQMLNEKNGREIREDALFWLGQQDHPQALEILLKTLRDDGSEEICEEAVFAVSRMELPEATAALVELARQSNRPEVREEAVFWLGQKASREAAAALDEIAHGDEEELQERAVFALAELPDGAGIPRLIAIAKTHHNPAIRKKAIFWLSQSEDERAVDAIIELAGGK